MLGLRVASRLPVATFGRLAARRVCPGALRMNSAFGAYAPLTLLVPAATWNVAHMESGRDEAKPPVCEPAAVLSADVASAEPKSAPVALSSAPRELGEPFSLWRELRRLVWENGLWILLASSSLLLSTYLQSRVVGRLTAALSVKIMRFGLRSTGLIPASSTANRRTTDPARYPTVRALHPARHPHRPRLALQKPNGGSSSLP